MMNVQALQDAQRSALLASSPERRQEAVASFILSCSQMAYDLKQMCDARRQLSHTYDHLEEAIASMEQEIAQEFRNIFGHPLFKEE